MIIGHTDTGIDSMLPSPEPLDNVVNVENVVEEAVGGMDGRIQETPTNVHEGVPKGRGNCLMLYMRIWLILVVTMEPLFQLRKLLGSKVTLILVNRKTSSIINQEVG